MRLVPAGTAAGFTTMTDVVVTMLVSEGKALQDSPIRRSSLDVRIGCLRCSWEFTMRYSAAHVKIKVDEHFELRGGSRVCKKA